MMTGQLRWGWATGSLAVVAVVVVVVDVGATEVLFGLLNGCVTPADLGMVGREEMGKLVEDVEGLAVGHYGAPPTVVFTVQIGQVHQ